MQCHAHLDVGSQLACFDDEGSTAAARRRCASAAFLLLLCTRPFASYSQSPHAKQYNGWP